MMLASLLFGTTPQPPTDDAPPPWQPGPAPSSRELLTDNVTRCGTALSQALNTARHPRRFAARGGHAAATIRQMSTNPEPRSSLLAPIGAERRFAVVRTELASLTSAAHSQGGTVNDALLAVIAGGLRALLTERGEPVDAMEPHARVPVALAHAEGDEAGNRLGQIVVRLPIGIPDTSARLALIASRTKNLKPIATARRPLVLRGAALQRAAMWFAARQRAYSIYVANLPGPRTPLHLLDAPVQDLSPVVPLRSNLTIGVGAMSYAGRFSILTVADRDTCPDLDVFVAGMSDALAMIR
jgi:WS/DGAT/MGAT family acyltransferase